jgi:hypothetical protein
VEALSAVFDFNRAPYFQSFVEVRVERSQSRVVFAVIGVNGPLRWRDLQTSGSGRPAGVSDDDFVEFVIPLATPSSDRSATPGGPAGSRQ